MIGSMSLGNQVIDMTDWDLREGVAMKESMDVIRNRRARAVVLSTAMGVTKFRSQCAREDPHEFMRQSMSHVTKAIKCAKEQD